MDDAILETFKKLKLDPNKQPWEVRHGSKSVTCILHKALEKIAAYKQIKFDAPAMIANDPEKKVAAMCVTGHLGDRVEWAIGEASPSNNKNNYPYAMAEKRAKDRVILKLLNMAGDYYSQEEADQFEEAKPKEFDEPRKKDPEPEPQPDPEPAAEPKVSDDIRNWANQVNDSVENVANMKAAAQKRKEYAAKAAEDSKAQADQAKSLLAAGQVGGGLVSLANKLGLSDISALLGAGSLEQKAAQDAANIEFANIMAAQDRPLSLFGFLSDVVSGLPSEQGTQIRQEFGSETSPLQTAIGFGSAALGFPGLARDGGDMGMIEKGIMALQHGSKS